MTTCDYCHNETTTTVRVYNSSNSIRINYCENCAMSHSFVCDQCGTRWTMGNYYGGGLCYGCESDSNSEEYEEENNEDFDDIEIPFNILKSKSFKINPFKETVGVEIECLNRNLGDNAFNHAELLKYGFNQTHDGSLTDNIGIEFNSLPSNGDRLLKQIKDFSAELQKRQYFVNNSCGLHIHIRIPKKIELLKKIILFYFKYEQFLFKMLPKSRYNNSYCLPLNQKGMYSTAVYNLNKETLPLIDTMDCLKKNIYCTGSLRRISSIAKEKYNNKRYSWLNLHSVFYHGTLEIRSHSGTTEADKILNWVMIHLNCINICKNLNYETIEGLPETEQFFLSLFTKELRQYISKRTAKFNPSTPQTAVNLLSFMDSRQIQQLNTPRLY